MYLRDHDVGWHLITLQQVKHTYQASTFDENEQLRIVNKNKKLEAKDLLSERGQKKQNEANEKKQRRRIRSFKQTGSFGGFFFSFISNNAIFILYCVLLTLVFIMKSNITKGSFMRDMRISLCEEGMNVNNNILETMMYTVRGSQLTVEDADIDKNTYEYAPLRFANILINNRQKLTEILPTQREVLDGLLTGNLCDVLALRDLDTKGLICSNPNSPHTNHGLIGYLIWMKDSSKGFRERMYNETKAYIDYSEGLPILGDVVHNKPLALNSQVVWYSLEYVNTRYINGIIWSRLFKRLGEWVEGQLTASETSMDTIFNFLVACVVVGGILPSAILMAVSLAKLNRDYNISLSAFWIIDSKVIYSNPQLMYHLKIFFNYSNH